MAAHIQPVREPRDCGRKPSRRLWSQIPPKHPVTTGLCADITCLPALECQSAAGACDPATGLCGAAPPKANGTVCSIGFCQGGVCTGGQSSTHCFVCRHVHRSKDATNAKCMQCCSSQPMHCVSHGTPCICVHSDKKVFLRKPQESCLQQPQRRHVRGRHLPSAQRVRAVSRPMH